MNVVRVTGAKSTGDYLVADVNGTKETGGLVASYQLEPVDRRQTDRPTQIHSSVNWLNTIASE